jgi:hypothetical protein
MDSPILGPPHQPSPALPPNRRQMATDGPRLRLAGRIDAAAVQQQLARTPTFTSHPGLAHVDLAGATSFDLPGLILVLAAVSDRAAATGQTKFRLPTSDLARHVLRMWTFPAAASVVARAPFRALVEKSDLEYFGEISPRRTTRLDTNPTHYLMVQKPFGISAYRITDIHSVLQIMDDEIEHWRSYAVIKLLERLLHGKSIDDIARVIIQELVSNILQHPGASIAITAARLEVSQDSPRTSSSGLTFVLWDDGASIISALRLCLQSELPERPSLPAGRDRFVLEEGSWTNGRLIYSSDWTPGPDAADPELLLASLYIGLRPITFDQDPSSGYADSPIATEGPEGLLPLYRTVLHDFGGSLEIRSKSSSLTLSSNVKPGHYKVKLSVDDNLPAIAGNLVIVKLPVIDA